MENEVPLNTPPTSWERQAIEKLLLADVRERRAARRWRMVRGIVWALLFGAVAWALLADDWLGDTAASVRPHTAMIAIKGEIADDADASAEYVLPALRSAMAEPGAKALVLLINSPGGSPVQAGLIHDEIGRLRKLHDKPVYTVVEESCASAAYYIAAASDKIYVDKASLVGSIGVLINGFGFVGTLDKLGIERRLLTAGDNKGFLDPFSPQSDKHREHAQKMLDQIHQQFITVVRQGRGDRLKETPEMFSGLFWTGEQAVQLGLADQLGSLNGVARDVVKAAKLVDYTHKADLMERFAKRVGASAGASAARALRTLSWH